MVAIQSCSLCHVAEHQACTVQFGKLSRKQSCLHGVG